MGEVRRAQRKQTADLKRQAQAALAAVAGPSAAPLPHSRPPTVTIDEGQEKALWERVRELFDYPVFVAAPKTVGITSTGETGEGVANELVTCWMRSGNSILGPEMEPSRRTRQIFPCPPLPDPAVEGRPALDPDRARPKRGQVAIRCRLCAISCTSAARPSGPPAVWAIGRRSRSAFPARSSLATVSTPFKGAMFAAYPGDLVFSKIDARNGALGIVPGHHAEGRRYQRISGLDPRPDPIGGRPTSDRLLRAAHFRTELQRQASGTSGRKRVTADGFLGIEALRYRRWRTRMPSSRPTPPLIDHAARLEQEAQAIEDAGLRAFEAALGARRAAALAGATGVRGTVQGHRAVES